SQTSAGTLVADDNGGFDVIGSHTYAGMGAYSLAVAIVDAGGSTVSASGTVTVSGSAQLPVMGNDITATQNLSYSGVVASFTSPNPSAVPGDFTVTVDWGDGQSSSGTVTANAN